MNVENDFFDDLDETIAWDGKPAPFGAPAVPEGTYMAEAVACSFEKSAKKGTPAMKVEFEIREGQFKGKKIRHAFWLTAKNLQYVARDLQTITGQVVCRVNDLRNLAIVGKRAKILVYHETVDGRKYAKIRGFLPVASSQPIADGGLGN